MITPTANKKYTMIDFSNGNSRANPNLYAMILKIRLTM